jgi:hypothetical protein
MWIRSQDKNNLINASVLHIAGKKDSAKTIRAKADTDSDFVFLGKYNSDIEAIKVLDLIQERVELCETKTFQMPHAGFSED